MMLFVIVTILTNFYCSIEILQLLFQKYKTKKLLQHD